MRTISGSTVTKAHGRGKNRIENLPHIGQTKSPSGINLTIELEFARIFHFWREAQRLFCVRQAASSANSILNIRIRNFDWQSANAANIYTRPTIAQKDEIEMVTHKPFSEPQMFAPICCLVESFYSFVFINYSIDDLSIWTRTICVTCITDELWVMTHGVRLASSIGCFVLVFHHSKATSIRIWCHLFFYFSERSFFSTHQGRKYTALSSTKFRRHRKRKSQLPTSLVHCSWSDGQILITEKIVIFFHSIPGHSPEFGINSTNSDTNSCARRSDCYFTSRNNHFYSWIELFTILLLHFSSHLNFTL